MTIADWLRHAAARLEASGCPDPKVDSTWIAENTLGMTRSGLVFGGTRDLNDDQLRRLNEALERRTAGEPVQYILGTAPFMGMEFIVTPDVLIPRQDTETLAEAVVVEARRRESAKLLDLCTGSGALGLCVASLCPDVQATLADVSAEALDVARANAHRLGVRATFRHGDMFAAVRHERFDVIACNPPYIPTAELDGLQREVQFEPRIALDGGVDGLSFYRTMAAEAPAHLNEGGAVLVEVGMGQAQDVRRLFDEGLGAREGGVIKDLNGIERVVWARS